MAQLISRLQRTLVTLVLSVTLLVTFATGTRSASAATPTALHAYAMAGQVLNLLNAERAINGLRPLVRNTRLAASAHRHNLMMARYDSMSHQLPGELSLGGRLNAAGYPYRIAGENIAWNTNWSLLGAFYLQRYMCNERSPYDAHRRNILSRSFAEVGIDIYMDGPRHIMWITEDFGHR